LVGATGEVLDLELVGDLPADDVKTTAAAPTTR